MYIAICDDQPKELRTLTVLLQGWQKDHPGVRCQYFRSADTLLEAARHERFTLYLRENQPDEALIVKSGSAIIRVPFSLLAFVEVRGKHLYFNRTDGQVREVPGSMKDYEQALLARPEFIRIHRSYIVNMLQIEELSPAGVRTFSGALLPISRLLYSKVQEDYMAFLFAER